MAGTLEAPKTVLSSDQPPQRLMLERQRRQEFYQWVTDDIKAEFINGEIICHSPVRLSHNLVGKRLLTLLDTHVEIQEFGMVGYEKLMISLTRNDYEPDLCFFFTEQAESFDLDQRLFPAPAFIVEILSPSTEEKDRGIKMKDYAAHGVREYWLIEANERFVERYLLNGNTFQLVETVHAGPLKSDVIAGFAIPLEAIFEKQPHLQALREMLQGEG